MNPSDAIFLIQLLILLLASIFVMTYVYHKQHKILWHFPVVATIGTLFINDGFINPLFPQFWKIKPIWIVVVIFLVACRPLLKDYLFNDNFSKSLFIGVGIGVVAFLLGLLVRGIDATIGNASHFRISQLLWELVKVVLKEEMVFRAYLFVYIMEMGVSFRIANSIQSLLFTTLHFWRYLNEDNWPMLVIIFISSLVVGYVIYKYKNLACGFSEHLAVNGGSLVVYLAHSTLFAPGS